MNPMTCAVMSCDDSQYEIIAEIAALAVILVIVIALLEIAWSKTHDE